MSLSSQDYPHSNNPGRFLNASKLVAVFSCARSLSFIVQRSCMLNRMTRVEKVFLGRLDLHSSGLSASQFSSVSPCLCGHLQSPSYFLIFSRTWIIPRNIDSLRSNGRTVFSSNLAPFSLVGRKAVSSSDRKVVLPF